LPVGDFHEQEERRLFYVGMTRACDRLFFTAADYYGEAKREKKLSQFVIETLGEKAISRQQTVDSGQLSIFDFQPAPEPEILATDYRLPINYLSYSQIDTFDTCPRRYRFRYIQRIPVPPSAAASFGNSMHKALRDFYQAVKEKKKPTKKNLLQFLERNWSAEGYASKTHEKRMIKQGERMLNDFYDKAYDPKRIPKAVEQMFVIKASPSLRIGGKIDRVDESRGKLEIIDYKTGKTFDQKVVDKSLQMTVYALAATDKGIHAKKPEEVVLSFYFLDSGEKKSTKRAAKELKEAKKELIEKANEIEKSEFEPIPGKWCDWCDYRLLCEAWR